MTSMTLVVGPISNEPAATIRSPRMARSPRRAGAPVPSIKVPLRNTTSATTGLFGARSLAQRQRKRKWKSRQPIRRVRGIRAAIADSLRTDVRHQQDPARARCLHQKTSREMILPWAGGSEPCCPATIWKGERHAKRFDRPAESAAAAGLRRRGGGRWCRWGFWRQSADEPASAAELSVTVLLNEPIGTIKPAIYSQFAEHIGGVIYDGIWVGTDSKVANIGRHPPAS